MIKKEWLVDYESKDHQEFVQFLNSLSKPKMRDKAKYPRESRFPKLARPYAISPPSNLWSQLPFYGTSFVSLPPYSREQMIEAFGWGTDIDINNLISLSKKTGRIQFILPTSPLNYQNLDYLEPILRELRPPLMFTNPRVQTDEDKLYYNEFIKAGSTSFIPMIVGIYSSFPEDHVRKRIHDYATDYVILKKMGYYSLTEEILKYMPNRPDIVNAYFTIFGNLLVVPTYNPLIKYYDAMGVANKSNYQESVNLLNGSTDKSISDPVNEIIMPGEVGRLLIKKLTFFPESYEACLSVIMKYKQEDLYNVLNAVKEGCENKKIDLVESKSQELSDILDNLWKDSGKISKLSKGISDGFSISLAAIGLAIPPVGGLGILAGLGLKVADEFLPTSFSEKIAKTISKNYLLIINDFKDKYKISN